ncbi:MAG: reverse transcriptase-like protein [Candidatus Bipolaricaulia bacterium]
MEQLTVYFDGACEPINPGGTATYGFVIYQVDKPLHRDGSVVGSGPQMSNNVAEYRALLAALEWLLEHGYTDHPILVRGDSKLVISQMQGQWEIRQGLYKRWAFKAQKLARGFRSIQFQWIPGDKNGEADALSRRFFVESFEAERRERARKIPRDAITRVGDGQYIVKGTQEQEYEVDLEANSCTCPDFKTRCEKIGMRCKHIWAVIEVQQVENKGG